MTGTLLTRALEVQLTIRTQQLGTDTPPSYHSCRFKVYQKFQYAERRALELECSALAVPSAVQHQILDNALKPITQVLQQVEAVIPNSDQVASVLSQLQQKCAREYLVNERELDRLIGQPILHGQVIQLMEVSSGKFLTVRRSASDTSTGALSCTLLDGGDPLSWFSVSSGYGTKEEGECVQLEELIQLSSATVQGVGLSVLDQALPSRLMPGLLHSYIERLHEIAASDTPSVFKILPCSCQPVSEQEARTRELLLHGTSAITIYHRASSSLLLSDGRRVFAGIVPEQGQGDAAPALAVWRVVPKDCSPGTWPAMPLAAGAGVLLCHFVSGKFLCVRHPRGSVNASGTDCQQSAHPLSLGLTDDYQQPHCVFEFATVDSSTGEKFLRKSEHAFLGSSGGFWYSAIAQGADAHGSAAAPSSLLEATGCALRLAGTVAMSPRHLDGDVVALSTLQPATSDRVADLTKCLGPLEAFVRVARMSMASCGVRAAVDSMKLVQSSVLVQIQAVLDDRESGLVGMFDEAMPRVTAMLTTVCATLQEDGCPESLALSKRLIRETGLLAATCEALGAFPFTWFLICESVGTPRKNKAAVSLARLIHAFIALACAGCEVSQTLVLSKWLPHIVAHISDRVQAAETIAALYNGLCKQVCEAKTHEIVQLAARRIQLYGRSPHYANMLCFMCGREDRPLPSNQHKIVDALLACPDSVLVQTELRPCGPDPSSSTLVLSFWDTERVSEVDCSRFTTDPDERRCTEIFEWQSGTAADAGKPRWLFAYFVHLIHCFATLLNGRNVYVKQKLLEASSKHGLSLEADALLRIVTSGTLPNCLRSACMQLYTKLYIDTDASRPLLLPRCMRFLREEGHSMSWMTMPSTPPPPSLSVPSGPPVPGSFDVLALREHMEGTSVCETVQRLLRVTGKITAVCYSGSPGLSSGKAHLLLRVVHAIRLVASYGRISIDDAVYGEILHRFRSVLPNITAQASSHETQGEARAMRAVIRVKTEIASFFSFTMASWLDFTLSRSLSVFNSVLATYLRTRASNWGHRQSGTTVTASKGRRSDGSSQDFRWSHEDSGAPLPIALRRNRVVPASDADSADKAGVDLRRQQQADIERAADAATQQVLDACTLHGCDMFTMDDHFDLQRFRGTFAHTLLQLFVHNDARLSTLAAELLDMLLAHKRRLVIMMLRTHILIDDTTMALYRHAQGLVLRAHDRLRYTNVPGDAERAAVAGEVCEVVRELRAFLTPLHRVSCAVIQGDEQTRTFVITKAIALNFQTVFADLRAHLTALDYLNTPIKWTWSHKLCLPCTDDATAVQLLNEWLMFLGAFCSLPSPVKSVGAVSTTGAAATNSDNQLTLFRKLDVFVALLGMQDVDAATAICGIISHNETLARKVGPEVIHKVFTLLLHRGAATQTSCTLLQLLSHVVLVGDMPIKSNAQLVLKLLGKHREELCEMYDLQCPPRSVLTERQRKIELMKAFSDNEAAAKGLNYHCSLVQLVADCARSADPTLAVQSASFAAFENVVNSIIAAYTDDIELEVTRHLLTSYWSYLQVVFFSANTDVASAQVRYSDNNIWISSEFARIRSTRTQDLRTMTMAAGKSLKVMRTMFARGAEGVAEVNDDVFRKLLSRKNRAVTLRYRQILARTRADRLHKDQQGMADLEPSLLLGARHPEPEQDRSPSVTASEVSSTQQPSAVVPNGPPGLINTSSLADDVPAPAAELPAQGTRLHLARSEAGRAPLQAQTSSALDLEDTEAVSEAARSDAQRSSSDVPPAGNASASSSNRAVCSLRQDDVPRGVSAEGSNAPCTTSLPAAEPSKPYASLKSDAPPRSVQSIRWVEPEEVSSSSGAQNGSDAGTQSELQTGLSNEMTFASEEMPLANARQSEGQLSAYYSFTDRMMFGAGLCNLMEIIVGEIDAALDEPADALQNPLSMLAHLCEHVVPALASYFRHHYAQHVHDLPEEHEETLLDLASALQALRSYLTDMNAANVGVATECAHGLRRVGELLLVMTQQAELLRQDGDALTLELLEQEDEGAPSSSRLSGALPLVRSTTEVQSLWIRFVKAFGSKNAVVMQADGRVTQLSTSEEESDIDGNAIEYVGILRLSRLLSNSWGTLVSNIHDHTETRFRMESALAAYIGIFLGNSSIPDQWGEEQQFRLAFTVRGALSVDDGRCGDTWRRTWPRFLTWQPITAACADRETLVWAQTKFDRLGATAMCVAMMCSIHASVRLEATHLLVALLEGGNRAVQQTLFELLAQDALAATRFFECLRDAIQRGTQSMKSICRRWATAPRERSNHHIRKRRSDAVLLGSSEDVACCMGAGSSDNLSDEAGLGPGLGLLGVRKASLPTAHSSLGFLIKGLSFVSRNAADAPKKIDEPNRSTDRLSERRKRSGVNAARRHRSGGAPAQSEQATGIDASVVAATAALDQAAMANQGPLLRSETDANPDEDAFQDTKVLLNRCHEPLFVMRETFRLLQLMVEGHFKPLQEMLGSQKHLATSVDLMQLAVDLLATGHTFLERSVEHGDHLLRELMLQVVAFLREMVQGPCEVNQEAAVVRTQLLLVCNRVFALDYLGEDVKPERIAAVSEVKTDLFCLLINLLERSPRGGKTGIRMINMLDFQALQGQLDVLCVLLQLDRTTSAAFVVADRNMQTSDASRIEDAVDLVSASPEADAALHNELTTMLSFLRTLMASVGAAAVARVPVLAVLERAAMLKPEELFDAPPFEAVVGRYLTERVGSVEVDWNGVLERVFFPITPECRAALTSTAWRTSAQTTLRKAAPTRNVQSLKALELLAAMEDFRDHITCDHALEQSGRFLIWTARNRRSCEVIAVGSAVATLFVSFLSYGDTYQHFREHHRMQYRLVKIINCISITAVVLRLVGVATGEWPMFMRRHEDALRNTLEGWCRWAARVRAQSALQVQAFTDALHNIFARRSARMRRRSSRAPGHLAMKASQRHGGLLTSRILSRCSDDCGDPRQGSCSSRVSRMRSQQRVQHCALTAGAAIPAPPESRTEAAERKLPVQLYGLLVFPKFELVMFFLIANTLALWPERSPFLNLVNFGFVFSDWTTGRMLFEALSLSGDGLLRTSLLAVITILVFALGTFVTFVENTDYEALGHEPICRTLYGCVGMHFLAGTVGQGNIGHIFNDAAGVTFVSDDPFKMTRMQALALWVFLFYMIWTFVLSNIFIGQIVDAFSALRSSTAAIREDSERCCLICSVDRITFQQDAEIEFEAHVAREHNVLQYVYFLHFLSKTDPEDHSGVESWVHELLQSSGQRRIGWIPIGTAIALEATQERRAAEAQKLINGQQKIQDALQRVNDALSEMAKPPAPRTQRKSSARFASWSQVVSGTGGLTTLKKRLGGKATTNDAGKSAAGPSHDGPAPVAN